MLVEFNFLLAVVLCLVATFAGLVGLTAGVRKPLPRRYSSLRQSLLMVCLIRIVLFEFTCAAFGSICGPQRVECGSVSCARK